MKSVVVVSRVQKYSAARDPVHIAKTASRMSRATREPFERLTGGASISREGPRCVAPGQSTCFHLSHCLLPHMGIHDKAPQFNPILPKSSMEGVLAPRAARSSSNAAATSSLTPAPRGPATINLPSIPYAVTNSITTFRAK